MPPQFANSTGLALFFWSNSSPPEELLQCDRTKSVLQLGKWFCQQRSVKEMVLPHTVASCVTKGADTQRVPMPDHRHCKWEQGKVVSYRGLKETLMPTALPRTKTPRNFTLVSHPGWKLVSSFSWHCATCLQVWKRKHEKRHENSSFSCLKHKL